MHCGDPGDSNLLETLNGPNPKVNIGINRIFNKNRNVNPAECFSDLLNGKGIYGSPRSDPQHVDSVFQGFIGMLGIGNLGCGKQPGFLFNLLQPLQTLYSNSFKRVWPGAGLPDSGPVNLGAGIL